MNTLNWVDWLVVVFFMTGLLAISLYFTKRAATDIQSFFVSGRSLPWHMAGFSLIATSFAADTPLWVTSLVRQYGIYYIWQYWAPFIGATLAVVLFARLWRRMGFLTDIEFIECRFSGKLGGVLRFWEGATLALLFCPLIIGWVTKAMETISREAMGLTPEYRMWTTIVVVATALFMCTMSGLWGVIYTAFFQFIIATGGTIILAVMAVRHVGGLDKMIEQIASVPGTNQNTLRILPSIGSGLAQMSIWNAIGYFGILWWQVAASSGYQAQRLLACKNSRHASFAMLLHTIVYYGIISWPWIIVALCSLIIFPTLGEGVTNDSAYPRMIVKILPIGMRGVLVAALISAFTATISTLFNWGSSYLVNDIYKRFFVRDASTKHYVWIARLATLIMGVAGGLISFLAKDIQQLLGIAFILSSGLTVVGIMRWFWWRLNAAGNLIAIVYAWAIAPLLLFGRILDEPARRIFHLSAETNFSDDPNLLGARMLFMMVSVGIVAIVASYLTKPTDLEHLRDFLMRAKPFKFFWRPVIRKLGCDYVEHESMLRTLLSWILASVATCSLIFGIGKLLLGEPKLGMLFIVICAGTLYLTVKRIMQDFPEDANG